MELTKDITGQTQKDIIRNIVKVSKMMFQKCQAGDDSMYSWVQCDYDTPTQKCEAEQALYELMKDLNKAFGSYVTYKWEFTGIGNELKFRWWAIKTKPVS